MAERARHRGRLVVAWLLTVGLAGFALLDDDDDQRVPPAVADDAAGPAKLRIEGVSDAEVSPGDAIVVRLSGALPDAQTQLVATVGRLGARILVRREDSVVVRIPGELAPGRAGLRLLQGERRSKAFDLMVRPLNLRKLVGQLLGGLALLVFGLGFLAQGFRRLAGRGIRVLLGRLSRGGPQAVGLGVLLGATTQLTTSTAGITVGLVESRLLAASAGLGVLIGGQLGASVIGALLPSTFTRQSLFVIVIGVVWLRLAANRRIEAIGQAVLGLGLLYYGLHLLHQGLQPLVENPKILPYISTLQADSAVAILACAAVGVGLAVLLQGPGPVFGLVVGLVQASGALGLGNALAILAGTSLGGALVTLLVAWPTARSARPLALINLAVGAAGSALALAGLPLWVWLANAVVPGRADQFAYGKASLLPSVDAHLAVGFIASQLAVTGLATAALPWLRRRLEQRAQATAVEPTANDPAAARRRELAILRHSRGGLEGALALACQGDRDAAVTGEHALQDARREVEELFAQVVGRSEEDVALEPLRRQVAALLRLHRAVEGALRVAELANERNLNLNEADQAALRALHGLVVGGFDELVTALETGGAPDLEDARAREIRINARESELRGDVIKGRRIRQTASVTLGVADLLDAYEHVGNHLYRVCESLADEDGDTLG